MAVAAAISVANIYYNQPILSEIARSLHMNESQAGNVAILSQAGYGLGLFFLIPLGDKLNRKKLVLSLLSVLVVFLLMMSLAANAWQIQLASLFVGFLSVSAQIILPMAATLNRASRGKTLGTIFSGILIGILAARVVSGFIAEWLSWRYVYGISAVLTLITDILIFFYLPNVSTEFAGNYLQLMKSTVQQIKRFALLRQSALIGALVFGLFCSFWTTLTFHLSSAPFYYHSDTIGLFGFVAIGGALAAPAIGKMADKGNAMQALLLAIGFIIISILLMMVFPESVTSFVIAVLLLDVGAQTAQVTNIASIYTLDESAHSRINTVYMTTYFIGGAVGTTAGMLCWQWGGWNLVTWQMLLWACMALAIILMAKKSRMVLA